MSGGQPNLRTVSMTPLQKKIILSGLSLKGVPWSSANTDFMWGTIPTIYRCYARGCPNPAPHATALFPRNKSSPISTAPEGNTAPIGIFPSLEHNT